MAIEVRSGCDVDVEGGAVGGREVIQLQGFHSEGNLVIWKRWIVFIVVEGGEYIDRSIERFHKNKFDS